MKKFALLAALIVALISGCTNNTTGPAPSQNGSLKLYLVDSPSSLDSIIIFVKSVEVHKAGGDTISGWSTINNSLRAFDLQELRNGASAVLGDTVLDAGKYTQIRLILGDGSYIRENGNKYYLNVSSGFQTGIKLYHEFTIEPDYLYELILDFNVDKSIYQTGTANYMMKPVIRIVPKIISGTISGKILQTDAEATVFTITGSDTVSTFPDTNGYFKLMALPEGSYDVEIQPGNTTYRDTVISNINVIAEQNKDIGTIELPVK